MTAERKPKPTHLKLVAGTPGKRRLPAVSELLAPPVFLTDEARAEWDRVAPQLVGRKLLTLADYAALVAYCQCYARWARAERALNQLEADQPQHETFIVKSATGAPIPNPMLARAERAAADMLKWAAEFGMTPSARSRV